MSIILSSEKGWLTSFRCFVGKTWKRFIFSINLMNFHGYPTRFGICPARHLKNRWIKPSSKIIITTFSTYTSLTKDVYTYIYIYIHIVIYWGLPGCPGSEWVNGMTFICMKATGSQSFGKIHWWSSVLAGSKLLTNEQWKKPPWLFRLYRGLYYPTIWGLYKANITWHILG